MAKTKFILSNQSVNSYGFIVLTSGIDLSQFNENPVMLLNHCPDDILGKWDNVKVEGVELTAETIFDENDPEAMIMSGKVDQKMLNGCSVGFQPIEWELGGIPGYENVPVVTKCILKEVSLTPIPSNGTALRLYDKEGALLSDDKILTILNSNNPKQNDMKKLAFFIAALQAVNIKLSVDATEDDVLKAVQTLATEHTQLTSDKATLEGKLKKIEDQAKVDLAAKKTELVDSAIAAGKITVDKKEQYLKLADADFDATKMVLDGMPVRKSLSDQLDKGDKGGASKFADWDYKKLHRENPTELARIKAEEPERYKELYNAAYKTA